MKINVTKEWCIAMAENEVDGEVGAGLIAAAPVIGNDFSPDEVISRDSHFAFGRFVNLMRRQRHLSMEKLAEDADIDTDEILSIESDAYFAPEARTVYNLSGFFHVPLEPLMELSGLTQLKDASLMQEAVRFAARSESVEELTPDEQMALESFVVVLSEKEAGV